MIRSKIVRASQFGWHCSSLTLPTRACASLSCASSRFQIVDCRSNSKASTLFAPSSLRQNFTSKSLRNPILEHARLFSNTQRSTGYVTRDTKGEEKARSEKLRVDPAAVSSTSTITPIFGDDKPTNTPANEANDVDMLAGLKSDLKTVSDTFRLQDVPREVFYIGMAGLIPYVATTASTLYLAWELKYAHLNGMGYFVNRETAETLLHFLEPLQVGYGAVILSFLGAIHWGLEFAGYGGRKSTRRYAIGLIAPALAWPTILLPLHEGLLTQFIGFTGMYFFDTSATTAGLAPPWYSTYRFVLTFVVGASIVLTLVGRGKIGEGFGSVPNPTEHLREIRAEQWRNLDRERNERLTKLEIAEQKKRRDESTTKSEEKGENDDQDSSKGQKSSGKKEEGSGKPGDGNEPVREEMKSKSRAKPAVSQGPEPSPEKKSNVKSSPEGKDVVETSEPKKNSDKK